MFIWVDLRHYILPHSTNQPLDIGNLRISSPDVEVHKKREALIVATCLKNCVGVGYGTNFFTEELGWFRITFTAPKDILLTGLRRFVQSLEGLDRHI